MRLLFKQSCQCTLTTEDVPRPHLDVTEGFDTDDETPQVKVTFEMHCSLCGKPWESYAGLQYVPKQRRIITS